MLNTNLKMTNVNFLIILALLLKPVTSGVYTTPDCRKAALYILNFIDSSVDPCEDFYRFTCGDPFNKTYDTKAVSLEAMVKSEVDNQIITMLAKPIDSSEPKAIQGLKKFFQSCVDEATIERNGFNSIKRALGYLGGWPVVEGSNWNEREFNLEELLIALRRMGYNFKQLFYIGISTGEEHQRLMIGQPILDVIEDKDKESYHDYMVDTAVYLGADRETALVELQETLLFKQKLLQILEKEQQFDRKNFRRLQKFLPVLRWEYFVNNILPPNTNITDDREVYLPSTDYLRNLDNLLKEVSNRTLANYIIWEAIDAVVPFLPKEFRDYKKLYINLSSRITVKEESQSRLDFCKSKARQILRPTFEALYVREYYPPEKRQVAQEIVSAVKDEFIKLLRNTQLYDDHSKDKVLEKVSAITYSIGAPESISDEQMLSQFFDGEDKISTNDFLTIASIVNRLSTNIALKFGSKTDFYKNFYEETLLPKAFYSSYFNTMVLPAAALQGFYFNDKRPQYLNFGTIGTTLGYELIHGLISARSGPYNSQLWTNTSTTNFNKKSECFIEQANNFTIDNSDLRMEGTEVLEENICDSTGVEIANRAYENWVVKNGEEKQLPGLTYTPKQLFWISTASLFCDTVPMEKLKHYRRAQPTFRTFAAFSNNEVFGKDFNCPVGSRMNPSSRCQIF